MGQGPPLPCLREADLTGPVRRALGSESAIPTDWQVHPLGGGRGEITGGVYRIAGGGRDQDHRVSWSLLLKVVPEPAEDDGPTAYNYWKREFGIYRAGLLADLPGIAAPRCWGPASAPGRERGCGWRISPARGRRPGVSMTTRRPRVTSANSAPPT